jgi:hypothetical protein
VIRPGSVAGVDPDGESTDAGHRGERTVFSHLHDRRREFNPHA